MLSHPLQNILQRLELKDDIDGAFLTGSHGVGSQNSDSDIDLVVVLKSNKTNIRAVYEKIDGVFADILFFDVNEIEALLSQDKLNANSFEGMFVSWLEKSDIKFDKSGILGKLKEKLPEIKTDITEHEVNDIVQKISYNFLCNSRYFKASDTSYKEALQIRLMYSVVDLLVGFLGLRNKAWRGEKDAIVFIKQQKPEFYEYFLKYQTSVTLEEKMDTYAKMVQRVFPRGVSLYTYDTPVALSRGNNIYVEMEKQKAFWEEISSK